MVLSNDLLPREKLIEYGPEKLLNHELMAILLSSGTKKESVFNLSKRLITQYENRGFKKAYSVKNIQNLWNIGEVHACKIVACIELGKRLFQKSEKEVSISTAKQAAHHWDFLKHEEKEQCRALYLSTQNIIIEEEVIAIGSLNTNALDIRSIFKPAIKHNAASIILAHNHPSGNPLPSEADIETQEHLQKTAEILQIPILDHIIIGKKAFFSFREGEIHEKKSNSSLDQS